jgi:hypothetical protein
MYIYNKQSYKNKSNMSNKFNLPTEVVELPSHGVLYPENSPLRSGKIEMK